MPRHRKLLNSQLKVKKLSKLIKKGYFLKLSKLSSEISFNLSTIPKKGAKLEMHLD